MKPRETSDGKSLWKKLVSQRAVEDAWFAGQDVEVFSKIDCVWRLLVTPVFDWHANIYRIKSVSREPRVIYVQEHSDGSLSKGNLDDPSGVTVKMIKFVEVIE